MAAASRYVLTLDIGSSAVRACAAPADRPWELSAGAERRQRVFRARGGGLEDVLLHLAILSGFALVFFMLGLRHFRFN